MSILVHFPVNLCTHHSQSVVLHVQKAINFNDLDNNYLLIRKNLFIQSSRLNINDRKVNGLLKIRLTIAMEA